MPTAITFSPEKGVEAAVGFEEGTPVYTITSDGNTIQEKMASGEAPKAIIVKNYNFDGFMDFSINPFNGGKGVNLVYRVFTYSKKLNRFLEHSTADMLPHLMVDKKKKRLLYTCGESVSRIPKRYAIKLSGKTLIKPENESP